MGCSGMNYRVRQAYIEVAIIKKKLALGHILYFSFINLVKYWRQNQDLSSNTKAGFMSPDGPLQFSASPIYRTASNLIFCLVYRYGRHTNIEEGRAASKSPH
jgi:hypothetical protein